ncbi:SDR family NAD(P)-dependent oxidoreductase [Nakamurella deserti]|uniref:SDR family NAD(P)-dependent oxidoreductase n=1 Tax=Nakamurella deserti TaxID=2164074 RepID=UPI000DBEAA7E|nr:SDR family NAD(P)-dependent oxidoreductase [Nakamurella deserti]
MTPLPAPDGAGPPTALITGATAGIGAGYARALAARGDRLVLVARDGARLAAAAADLRAAGAPDVEVLVADLTTPEGRDRVRQRLGDPRRPVATLVNNAGMGLGRPFSAVSPAELERQLALNVTAVLALTHAALPGMTARREGTVVNVASVAGLFPNPGASYAASKAWVVAFTEGLAMTLRGTGVRVQALCPGLVHTEFHDRAGIALGRVPAVAYSEVDTVVAGSLADLRRGRLICVPGPLYKTLVGVTRVLPRPLVRVLSRTVYGARE